MSCHSYIIKRDGLDIVIRLLVFPDATAADDEIAWPWVMRRGGYQKKNPINMSRIIGSKWTAMERTFGWRHFHATQKRKEGKSTYVLLVSTCDEKTQFWVMMRPLNSKHHSCQPTLPWDGSFAMG